MIFKEEKTTTRIDYEKITIELMKTIRKEFKDIRPEELLTLSGSFLTTLILSTVDTLDFMNLQREQQERNNTIKNVRIDKTRAALNLCDTISETIKDTIKYMYETEKLI